VKTYLYRGHECQIIWQELHKHGDYLITVHWFILQQSWSMPIRWSWFGLLHLTVEECSGISEKLTDSIFWITSMLKCLGEKIALPESGNLEMKAVPSRKVPQHRAGSQRTINWPKTAEKIWTKHVGRIWWVKKHISVYIFVQRDRQRDASFKE
jgi:hypothetical protein